MLWIALPLACSTEAPAPAAEGDAGRPRRKHNVHTETTAPEEEEEAVGTNRGPVVRSIRVSPSNPNRLSTLEAKVDATDPEGERLEIRYQWSVDGRAVSGERTNTFSLEDYERGQVVTLSVVVSDGLLDAKGDSPEFKIVNADPVVKTDPSRIERLDGLRVEVEDPDGDPLSFSVEGAPPAMSIDDKGVIHFVGTDADVGGQYVVKVKVEDGQGGRATMELPLTVAAGKKGNRGPAAAPPPGAPQ